MASTGKFIFNITTQQKIMKKMGNIKIWSYTPGWILHIQVISTQTVQINIFKFKELCISSLDQFSISSWFSDCISKGLSRHWFAFFSVADVNGMYSYLMSLIGAGFVGALFMLIILTLVILCYVFGEKGKPDLIKKESILRGQSEQMCKPLMR